MVGVLTGSGAAGLTWEVLARGEADGRLLTVIRRTQGAKSAASGFKSQRSLTDQLIQHWTGKADGTPLFVVVIATPEVESVIAVGMAGTEYPLVLSGVVEPFSLRFGAAPIPDGESVAEIRTVPASPTPRPRSFLGLPVSATRTGWYAEQDG